MKFARRMDLLKVIALLALITTLYSCEKSEDVTNIQRKIQGLWVGTIANSSSSQFYSLSIKPDGKLTFEGFTSNQEQFGAGTWTLEGSDFRANVTTLYGIQSNVGVQQLLTAKFNTSTGQISEGKYVNTSPANDSGTFSLTKVE